MSASPPARPLRHSRPARHATRAAAPTADAVEAPAADAVESPAADATQSPSPIAADSMTGATASLTITPAVTRVGFAPIVRIDSPRREIELCATSEAVDSYGTVFDYAASKDAFARWIGNVREMHDRRAVGSRVAVRFDDSAHRVYVTVRVSRGAQDTWEKILDGTLHGASIGAANVAWERQVRRVSGRTRALDVATHYDLVELSLVDNPSNPDALGISIVRDAVPDAAMLAPLDAAEPAEPTSPSAGHAEVAASEADTKSGQNGQHPAEAENNGAQAMSAPCPRTSAPGEVAASHRDPADDDDAVGALPMRPANADRALGPFSADPDGYPDAGVPARAEERPTADLGMDSGGEPNVRQRLHTAALSVLRGCACPLCQGAIAALGEDGFGLDDTSRASRAGDPARVTALRDSALARALAAGLSASASRLDRMDETVRGLHSILQAGVSQMAGTVGDLRLRIETLEAQPMPGGPAAHEIRAAEKTHALAPDGPRIPPNAAEQYRALESLAGRLTDPQAQIAVAAEMIRLRRS